MPEIMIIYRAHFDENGLSNQWWKEYSALTDDQKNVVNPIIYSNSFDDYERDVHDLSCLRVLSYYRIKSKDVTEDIIEIL